MIIQTHDEVKAVFSAPNINNSIEALASYIEIAAETYIIPFLSRTQWDKLQEDYTNNVETAAHLKLLKKAQIALIHLAYLLYSDDGEMQISDRGFTRLENEEEKTAYSGMVRKFTQARLRDGWTAIEAMISVLNADKATYNLWAESDEYKNLKSYFIWNSSEYRKYRMIKSFGVLWGMRGCTNHIQDEIIQPNIGVDLYEVLKTELAADEYSDDNKKIVPFINRAIAHLIVARAIDENIIEFSDEGITMQSFEGGNTGSKSTAADPSRIEKVKNEALKKGNAAIKELRTYLNDNASASKYASYFEDEDLYDDPNDDSDDQKFTNTTEGSFFAV